MVECKDVIILNNNVFCPLLVRLERNAVMATDNVKKRFEHRFKQVLYLIRSYNISYEETEI